MRKTTVVVASRHQVGSTLTFDARCSGVIRLHSGTRRHALRACGHMSRSSSPPAWLTRAASGMVGRVQRCRVAAAQLTLVMAVA